MNVLNLASGAKASAILGIGGYRPRRVVDNAEIVTMIDSSDEWIRTRSGIAERRWASPDETIQMMSVAASCAGFCYATAMADSFIRSGASKYVLIIGVERLSDMTDKHARSTAFIFADGAGAAVIGPSETPGIGPVVWGSDGEQAPLIGQTEPWDEAVREGEPAHWPKLRMEGNPVFKWASYTMAKTAAEALDAAGVRPEDLKVFAPHQANMRITDAMFRALKLPSEVVVARDIARQGNTSAASIPLAIEALLESGEAKSGDTCLIIGFGAGLVYAGQVIVLP